MRKNKHFITALAFFSSLTVLFAASFADIVTESGYEQFKTVLKTTVDIYSKGVDGVIKNGNVKTETRLSLDGKLLVKTSESSKFDFVNDSKESEGIEVFDETKATKTYSYSDSDTNIYYDKDTDTYNVVKNNYEGGSTLNLIKDPFKLEEAKDVERIIDAALGNIKDQVFVVNDPDGKKEFTFNLESSQMPKLIEAITALILKQGFKNGMYPGIGNFNGSRNNLPAIEKGIHFKYINSKASSSKEGYLNSINLECVMSGVDKNDRPHDFKVEYDLGFADLNKTVIKKPDLKDKKVEYSVNPIKEEPISNKLSQKHIGKWQNIVSIEKDEAFKKLKVRNLEITSITSDTLSGKYYETYEDEFKDLQGEALNFEFNIPITTDSHGFLEFKNIKSDSGTDISGNLTIQNSNIELFINDNKNMSYNNTFTKVYE